MQSASQSGHTVILLMGRDSAAEGVGGVEGADDSVAPTRVLLTCNSEVLCSLGLTNLVLIQRLAAKFLLCLLDQLLLKHLLGGQVLLRWMAHGC